MWSARAAPVIRGGLSGLVVTALLVAGGLEWVELRALNGLFWLRGAQSPRAPVVIVAIDEDSFDEFNLTWPWPRALHGQLIEILAAAKPAVIGLDILFVEPSAHGPRDDEALARSLSRVPNVVLAAAKTVEREAAFIKEDLNPPLKPLRDQAAGVGVANLMPDDDAFVRRGLLGLTHQGADVPSFDRVVRDLAVKAGIPSAGLPADPSILINYRGGPGTFPTFSYHRVLSGEVPADTFRGKIVLVGASTPILHDVFATPFAPSGTMPGVEIHANVQETLLSGRWIRRLPTSATIALVLLASVFAAWIAHRFRPVGALAIVAGAAVLAVLGGALALGWRQVWVGEVPVPLALVLAYGDAIIVQFVQAQREKLRLSRFFSPAVLREVVRQGQELGRTRRVITVLFSDIRGFSTFAERLPPEEVGEFLEEYMTSLTEGVFRHGGTVIQFVGDEIMALYNAPFDQPDHAVQAVRTGLDFQERVRTLSERWEARCGAPIRSGVGINTGAAVVGIVGSRQRVEYGAIGDTINLGSRLEGLTKTFGAPIIISESTYQSVRDQFAGRFLGEVTVKGRGVPVRIYAIESGGQSRATRVTLELPLTITNTGPDLHVSVQASLNDLSLTGLRAGGAPRSFTQGEVVGLSFELPGIAEAMVAEGRVMWVADGQAGIQFLELPRTDRERLERFLSNRGAPVGS
jgi:adenylate cyclase